MRWRENMLAASDTHVVAGAMPSLVRGHDTRAVGKEKVSAWELDAARAMQRSLMPAVLPSVNGCEVAAVWRPVGAVGGDGYDVIRLSDTRLALSIADVAGKGMPAALLMSHVLAMTRAYAAVGSSPRDLAGRVNRALCANAALQTFVTSCHAVLDMAARTLAVTNAGHVPPILVRADGTAVRLATGGPVLGVLRDAPYEQEEVALQSGDRLLFYTDGVTEVRRRRREVFGHRELVALLSGCGGLSPDAIADRIEAAVLAASEGRLRDDVAILAFGPHNLPAPETEESDG